MKTRKQFKKWASVLNQSKKKIFFSLLLLIAAFAFYGISANYIQNQNWNAVSDLILNNIGPYDLSFIFIGLYMCIVALFILYPLVSKPKELHYALSMLGLFVIVRTLFMLFTHLGAPADAIRFNFSGILKTFDFTNDLFFSGHTGIPFLGFLIFRKNKAVGYIMLASSIVLGITVLIMHVHYTIDVLSAFFITYGIYKIGNMIFRK